MAELFASLVAVLSSAGVTSSILLLVFMLGGSFAIIGWLLRDRTRLLNALSRKDGKIEGILDKYHTGQIQVSEAMQSIKEVLIELRVLAGRD